MFIIDGPGAAPVNAAIAAPVLTPDEVYQAALAAGSLSVDENLAYLTQARLVQNGKINKWRQDANFSFFTYNGKQIACDALSRSDIDGTNGYIANTNKLPPYWPGGWLAKDNTYVSIGSIDQWHAFYTAMYGQGLVNFGKGQTLKQQLKKALTLEAIRAVVW